MPESHYQRLNNCKRIGLLDSGVGGLTVLDKLKNLSSKDSLQSSKSDQGKEFIYLGDTARCPYGDRKVSEIVKFVTEIITWLTGKGVDGIVMACNTSASNALQAARDHSSVPIFDLITPTAEYVGQLGGKVAVMATTTTTSSRAFSTAIHACAPHLEVIEIPCPDLVPIIEKGAIFHDSTTVILRRYADILVKEKVEILIFGCTHFPFIAKPLKELLPETVVMIDPAEILYANLIPEIGSTTEKRSLEATSTIYVTGDPSAFAQVAHTCLGYSIGTVTGITVNELVGIPIADQIRPKQSSPKEITSIIPAV